ncbi:hypothetical protein H257_09148 [Aphanomyces astaci]|uniref:Transmembrane protein n=1 Tax=Aphanomyces astaci TaxID=112090 RepID=W4GAF5_APHAT|nr:hypothetical protein H257_09148 [Aphanomyces astaci]ETV76662.1 hypothetical protein H257_09148 [Aphanomyces astaci]|eukprot:XP_009833574.1 hypothetical protein H257_09148 [Aphanomyces astaci]
MQAAPTASALGAIPSGASFFPTPSEISVTMRWMRDHPVVAAATCAAATAASVVAYFALQHKASSTKSSLDDPLDTSDSYEPSLVACKASKRGESNASDHPTEKDSTLSFSSVGGAGDVASSPHTLDLLDAVPEQVLTHTADEYDSESPAWGWYVSLTPPEDMYAPPMYKVE